MSNTIPAAPGTPSFQPQQPQQKPSFVKRHPVTTVFLVLAVLGVCCIGGCAALVGSAVDEANKTTTPTNEPAEKAGKKDANTPSLAGQFKAHIENTGTPQEKAAAEHITRIQTSGMAGTADIHTNLAGGDSSTSTTSTAQLLASQYANWKHTDSGAGLVTVYGANGDMLAGENF